MISSTQAANYAPQYIEELFDFDSGAGCLLELCGGHGEDGGDEGVELVEVVLEVGVELFGEP